MQPEIWIGTIEVSFNDPGKPPNKQRAFTVVTTWASNAEQFRQKCDLMVESYGWRLLAVEVSNPVPPDAVFGDDVEDMLERTRGNQAAIIYGTFHTYPVM
jgi:hypothetical protein